MKLLTIILSIQHSLAAATTIITAFAPSPFHKTPPHRTTLHSSTRRTPTSDEQITIESYSRCLSPWEAKQSVKRESRQYSIIDRRPRWQKPLTLISKGVKKIVPKRKKTPGSLILLRCGESSWTKTGRFTGWGESLLEFTLIIHVHFVQADSYVILLLNCKKCIDILSTLIKYMYTTTNTYYMYSRSRPNQTRNTRNGTRRTPPPKRGLRTRHHLHITTHTRRQKHLGHTQRTQCTLSTSLQELEIE